ncbi:MAG: hypothetical protein JWP81_1564 [Ferruginibacter sp.]|nr:hypothetical protein [Ferruginibacter sp.]
MQFMQRGSGALLSANYCKVKRSRSLNITNQHRRITQSSNLAIVGMFKWCTIARNKTCNFSPVEF